ncbi:MAG: gamma carbonic anhydrase family protein [Bacteroidetes bacterium]|nr:gamma carbonic anhydrase family protein [Bacteroidota bacterium]
MSILQFENSFPKIHPTVFIAEGAHIIGDVEIGKDSSIWFNSVVRGDVNFIRIGERTNIQDNVVVHVTHDIYPTIIKSNVTIGHSAVIHACTILDFCLIGMNATILDNATIGQNSLIAAGALILQHSKIPEGVLVAGVPGKIIRDLTQNEIDGLKESANNYVNYVKRYLGTSNKK